MHRVESFLSVSMLSKCYRQRVGGCLQLTVNYDGEVVGRVAGDVVSAA